MKMTADFDKIAFFRQLLDRTKRAMAQSDVVLLASVVRDMLSVEISYLEEHGAPVRDLPQVRRTPPVYWRPMPKLVRAIDHLKRVKADIIASGGDKINMDCALSAAKSIVVLALQFNPDGREDCDYDYCIIDACCNLIVEAVEHANYEIRRKDP